MKRYLLLVEDDELVGQTIEAMLEDHYQVTSAATVDAAIDTLADPGAPPWSLILLDCLLPGGNLQGVLEVADRLRIPVVLTSGDPRESDRIDPHRIFLPKPFDQTALLNVLDAVH